MEENYLEPQFINDNEIPSHAVLWRYLDLNKFLSFLTNKSLHLTRLDMFEDKREGFHLEHLLFLHHKKKMDEHPMFKGLSDIMSNDNFPTQSNKLEGEVKKIQRFTFANCWVLGNQNRESVAMWNLYSKPNGVAIKVSYSDFKQHFSNDKVINHGNFKQIICSPVTYVDFQDEIQVSKLIKSGINIKSVFMKDISFSHENEFRIVLQENEREIPPIKYREGITNRHLEELHIAHYNYPGIPIELEEFEKYKFEVTFHPKTEKWVKESIRSIIEKLEINIKISDSKLELN